MDIPASYGLKIGRPMPIHMICGVKNMALGFR
jgi:hypothetical protein